MEQPARTILIVDDDPDMRRYLRDCLAPLGADLVEAGNGGEALPVLEGREVVVDLVITDVVMPGMDGPELVRRIEGDDAYPTPAVLFVTGAAEEVGPVGRPVLRKPFSGSLLRAYVEELLRPPPESTG